MMFASEPCSDVPEGSPALYLERIGLLADGQRVELSQSVVRGDRCRYFVELLSS
ncbi:MAG: UTRA domain-containing protein [Ktedonobacteraceae bacterium]|nr:UTRA domain-containing protein [Ktedonobacteraceae bacterium]MBO0793350.1 UTRA domain-containing protein [Ktedonobacteraceae bacterium]